VSWVREWVDLWRVLQEVPSTFFSDMKGGMTRIILSLEEHVDLKGTKTERNFRAAFAAKP